MAALTPEQLQELAEGISRITKSFKDLEGPVESFRDKSKKEQEQRQKFAKAIVDSTNALVQSTTAIGANGASFSSLNSAISGVTAVITNIISSKLPIISKIIKTVSAGVQYSIKEFDKAFTVFEQISEFGLADNFQDLLDSSQKLKLQYIDTGKILSKYSKELAGFGTSIVEGRDKFASLGNIVSEDRQEYQRIGITITDLNEYLAGYMDLQRSSNRLDQVTSQNVRENLSGYINQISVLSKYTGLQRKEIQEELRAKMREASYRAKIATLAPDAKKSVDDFLILMKTRYGPQIAQGIQDQFTGAIGSPESKALLATVGTAGVDALRAVAEGSMPLHEALNGLLGPMKEYEERTRDLAGIVKDQNVTTKFYVEANEGITKGEIKAREAISKEIEDAKKKQNDANDVMAKAKIEVYKFGDNLEKIATSFNSVMTAASKLSGALETITGKFRQWLVEEPKESPSPPAPAAAPAPASPRTPGPGRAGQGAKPTAAGSASPAPVKSGVSTEEDLRKLGFTLRPDARPQQTHVSGRELNPKLIELAKKIQNEDYFSFFTGFNDIRYDDSSAHRLGLGVDFVLKEPPPPELGKKIESRLRDLGASFAFDEYNNKSRGWTGPHFHAEVKALNGAIVDGPRSGFPATLHGNELIAPLGDNSILKELATTSASDFFDKPNTEILTQMNNFARTVENSNMEVARGLDSVKSVLVEIKNMQKTIAMRTFA